MIFCQPIATLSLIICNQKYDDTQPIRFQNALQSTDVGVFFRSVTLHLHLTTIWIYYGTYIEEVGHVEIQRRTHYVTADYNSQQVSL